MAAAELYEMTLTRKDDDGVEVVGATFSKWLGAKGLETYLEFTVPAMSPQHPVLEIRYRRVENPSGYWGLKNYRHYTRSMRARKPRHY